MQDTSPMIDQRKWLCQGYLKEIRSCIMWLIEVIRQINVIVMRQVMKIEQTGKTFLRKSRNWYQDLSEKINKN